MKLLSGLFLLFTVISFADDPTSQSKFLGYTHYLPVCKKWVEDAGFKNHIYGAFVNGEYREDACFGVDPMDTGSSEQVIKADAQAAYSKLDSFLKNIKLDTGYSSLWDRSDKLFSAMKILLSAANDGLSKESLVPFFRDVKFHYEMLTYDYYPVHVNIQNAKVGEAWKMAATNLEKIKKDFEGYL